MKNETKPTPGPWKYTPPEYTIYSAPYAHVEDADGNRIAAVNTEANARLIAAAPSMYDALVAALPALTRDCLTSSENGALITARAAIAKATTH